MAQALYVLCILRRLLKEAEVGVEGLWEHCLMLGRDVMYTTCQAHNDIPVRIEVDLQLTDMALHSSPDVVVSILVDVPDLVENGVHGVDGTTR